MLCRKCKIDRANNEYYFLDGGLGFSQERFAVCKTCVKHRNEGRTNNKYLDEQITALYYGAKSVISGKKLSEVSKNLENGITVGSNKMGIQNFLHLFGEKGNLPSSSKQMRRIFGELEEVSKLKIEKLEFFEKVESDLDKKITESKKSSSKARKKRIDQASKKPEEIQIVSRGFKRNPDVIIEVLLRADGKCECCNSSAPFIRKKDNTPYLEIHHKITLAYGGDDTLENAIAVCPNCHRKKHFGM